MTEVIGGGAVNDPFRWLEDDADPAVIAWQKRENDRAVAELAGSPHAASVAAAVRGAFEDLFTASASERFGEAWFRMVIPPGRSRVVLEVSSSATGKGRGAGHRRAHLR